MAKIPSVRPGYISPLTDAEHARLGRICVLWGQIDMLLDFILKWSYGFSQAQWDGMEIADRPLGTKISLLKKSFRNVGDTTILEILQELYEALNAVKGQRNHAIHGMWGWRVDDRKGTVEPCARYHKDPATPLTPSHLPALEKALCRCSNLAMQAYLYSVNAPPEQPLMSRRFFHGKAGPPSDTLTQWLVRVQPDHATLDHSFREGQLPRLEKLFPKK